MKNRIATPLSKDRVCMEKTVTVSVTKNHGRGRRLPRPEVHGHSGVVFEVYTMEFHQEILPGNHNPHRVVKPWIFFF